jgi:AcrR family transcriptional regulator
MTTATVEPPSQRRPGGRSARVGASVLAATIDALIERGYQNLSILEIAERAGVHDTSIYRRWRTKAQLVAEAVSRNAPQSFPPPDTGSFQGDMTALFRRVISWLDTPLGNAVSQVVTSPDPDLAAVRRAYWDSQLDGVREIVKRAVGRGEAPKSLDPWFVVEMCSGPMILRRLSGRLVTTRYLKTLLDRVIPMLQK